MLNNGSGDEGLPDSSGNPFAAWLCGRGKRLERIAGTGAAMQKRELRAPVFYICYFINFFG